MVQSGCDSKQPLNYGSIEKYLQSPMSPANPFFAHGVASGEPLSDAVVIWTRVQDAVDVDWEVSLSQEFAHIKVFGSCRAEPENDLTINVDVTELDPFTVYYYRFRAGMHVSSAGKTKTLPASGQQRARFAQVSCAKYNAGFFNAYAAIAQRADLDFLLHLGDYIYEASNNPPGSQTPGADIGRPFKPDHECKSLEDYRLRYEQYRSDPDVQAMHASLPIIPMVDDHEIADGAWRDGADEHDETRDGPWSLRKQAALKARSEWLPMRKNFPENPNRAYRTIQIGNLIDLLLLDTRTMRDRPVPPPEMYLESRSALGVHQRDWLYRSVESSKSRWCFIANPSVMSSTWSDSIDDKSRLALLKLKLIASNGVDPDWDQWDGYPHEREELLSVLSKKQGELIVLSGDIHASFVFELKSGSQQLISDPIGFEFVVPSITSQNLDDKMKWEPGTLSCEYQAALLELLPHAVWCDLDSHGYNVIDVNQDRVQVEYWHVQTVLQRSDIERMASSWKVRHGETSIERVD